MLSFTTPESTFTLTPVPSIPNSLVGAFRIPYSYDVAIFDDEGHYLITTSNSTPPTDQLGIELGCYSSGSADGDLHGPIGTDGLSGVFRQQ